MKPRQTHMIISAYAWLVEGPGLQVSVLETCRPTHPLRPSGASPSSCSTSLYLRYTRISGETQASIWRSILRARRPEQGHLGKVGVSRGFSAGAISLGIAPSLLWERKRA